jgi:hypothetical protein
MKLRPSLLVALVALSPLFAGLALAGSHSHHGTSRLGLNDAARSPTSGPTPTAGSNMATAATISSATASCVTWRGARRGHARRGRRRERRRVRDGWSKDSIRVVARIQAQAETKSARQALAKAVRIVNQAASCREGPTPTTRKLVRDVRRARAARMNLQIEANNGRSPSWR